MSTTMDFESTSPKHPYNNTEEEEEEPISRDE